MTPESVVGSLGLYAGTAAVGALSAVIPFVAIDVFLVGVTLHVGASPILIALVPLAALGQLAGKLPTYYGARRLAELPRWGRWIARFERRPHSVLILSTLTGLPPFSIVATAAGLLRITPRAFCAIVFLGRAARFTAVVAITLLA